MDKARLLKEYGDGKAISVLAKEFGVSRQAVLGQLKRAGVYKKDEVTPHVTPPAKELHVTSQKGKKVTPPESGSTVDIYEYAASLPPLEVYDDGSGNICPVRGNRYYFESLDIWLPIVRDDGPLADHVEYLPLGRRFKRSHPDHPDNLWKKEGVGNVRHPWSV